MSNRKSTEPGARERGSVTAETAIVLPAVVVVLALLLSALAAGIAVLKCGDAARTAARSLSRGDGPAQARLLAQHNAPEGAQLRFDRRDGVVRVRVSASVRPLGNWSRVLPSFPVSAGASAADEDYAGGPASDGSGAASAEDAGALVSGGPGALTEEGAGATTDEVGP